MKKTIGGFLFVLTAILLLLMTCDGPGGILTSSLTSPQPTDPPLRAEREAAPAAVPAPEAVAPAAGERATSSVEEAGTTPEDLVREVAPAPAPVTAETRAAEQAVRPVRPLSGAALTGHAAQPVPVHGLEALLAVTPRALEGGTEPAGILLIPVDSLRQQFRIPVTVTGDWLPTDYTRGQPSSTINTPTAYGQRWGDVYGGVGYQDRIRYDDWHDGVASLGLGLGNPSRYVGLDLAVNVLDTYTEFGKDRSLSLKLHRRLPHRTAIAVGHENIWHTDGTDGGSSRYVVVSKVMLFRDRPTSALGSMVVNVGMGNERFLSEEDFMRGEDGVNAFGSVGVRLLRPVNAIANWTGQDLALGLSIAPVRTWPLVITPAVVDVTGRAGDGTRFSISAGLSYNFRR